MCRSRIVVPFIDVSTSVFDSRASNGRRVTSMNRLRVLCVARLWRRRSSSRLRCARRSALPSRPIEHLDRVVDHPLEPRVERGGSVLPDRGPEALVGLPHRHEGVERDAGGVVRARPRARRGLVFLAPGDPAQDVAHAGGCWSGTRDLGSRRMRAAAARVNGRGSHGCRGSLAGGGRRTAHEAVLRWPRRSATAGPPQ